MAKSNVVVGEMFGSYELKHDTSGRHTCARDEKFIDHAHRDINW